MTIQLDSAMTNGHGAAAGERVLLLTATDRHSAANAARVIANVRGDAPDVVDECTVRVRGLDAKAAVDVLAELTWAGLTPETFSLL